MRGLDQWNLGMPGSCRLEPALARWIATEPGWDAATVELGINVIGAWPAERFATAAAESLAILASAKRPVFVTDLFPSIQDTTNQTVLAAYRGAVADACAAAGLRHVPGTTFTLGPDGLTADLVHPSERGMAAIARRWDALLPDLGTWLRSSQAPRVAGCR